MSEQTASFYVMSPDDCYRMLAAQFIGRLGVIIDGYPEIIPVNYAMDDKTVIFRSRPGTKLDHLQGANVTFQTDSFDAVERIGWSVLLRGRAEELGPQHSDGTINRAVQTPIQPWVPGTESHWVRILPAAISGRRISAGSDEQWRWGTAAYM